MAFYRLDGIDPVIEDTAEIWVAESAEIIGKVTLKPRSSVWFGSVLRGDNEMITIGEGTNIQDMTVVHTDAGIDVSIGKNCTIGHRVILHGCTIGNTTLIGMGSIIMNHAMIGEESIVGAGAVVTQGKQFPSRSLLLGNPARFVRKVSDEEVGNINKSAAHYYANARRFKNSLIRLSLPEQL